MSHPYDQSTIDKLHWQYGSEAALNIIFGRDEDTRRDQFLWRNIEGQAYTGSALALARRLVSGGESEADAAEMAGVSKIALRTSIRNRPL